MNSLTTTGFLKELSTANMHDRDHIAFTYSDEKQLAQSIIDFVRRGMTRNQINVFFVTKQEAEKYTSFLREFGINVDELIDSREIIIKLIDGWLLEKEFTSVADMLTDNLISLSSLSQGKGKTGLNIIGSMASNLAKHGRYHDCVFVEKYWYETIAKHHVPITLICPYEFIPRELESSLQGPHNSITRVISGPQDDIEEFVTLMIRRASADTIEPVIETAQDRFGPNLSLPLVDFLSRMREKNPSFKVRLITSIEPGNLDIVKKVAYVEGCDVRHIQGFRANIILSRDEYTTTTRSLEAGLPNEILWSNSKELVSQMRNLFQLLWDSAIPASLRIEELEEGQRIGEIRLSFDRQEIIDSTNGFLDEAKEEALVVISREGGIKDNAELFYKIRSKAAQGLRARILTRHSEQDSAIMKELESGGVEVRKLDVGSMYGFSLAIYDRKNMTIAQYLFPDAHKKSVNRQFLSGIISTNRHMIAGITAMFESLWEENELRYRAELMQNILTHDIRNYNQVARASAELLEQTSEDEETGKLVHSIIAAIDNSTDLVRKARILGSVVWQKDPVLLPVSLNDSFERSLSLIRKANPDTTIELTPSSKLPAVAMVIADDLLDQVFANILSNAVKHTKGKKVLIDVSGEEADEEARSDHSQIGRKQYWRVVIADRGKGIPDEVKRSVSMRYRGIGMGRGLGLSIVRALVVDRYSGRLELKNRVEGDYTQGTSVEVWLPKAE